MTTKDKLITEIRAVPIAGKTYEEYVDAVADRLVEKSYRKASEVAREIFEEIESCMVINQYKEFKILVDSYLTIKKKYTEGGE